MLYGSSHYFDIHFSAPIIVVYISELIGISRAPPDYLHQVMVKFGMLVEPNNDKKMHLRFYFLFQSICKHEKNEVKFCEHVLYILLEINAR
jgi:hypothetical protein